MYTGRLNDDGSYSLYEEDEFHGRIRWERADYEEELMKKIVAALNFYEQAHNEHTCYVCETTSKNMLEDGQGIYICRDPDGCVQRAKKSELESHYCPVCRHTGKDVQTIIEHGKYTGQYTCDDLVACFERAKQYY